MSDGHRRREGGRAEAARRPRARLARGAALALAFGAASLVASRIADAAAGDPLPGLSSAHLGWFAEGLEAFGREYTAETGLGPTFNEVSCVACHSVPAPGGGSEIAVTRFGRSDGVTYDALVALGGPLLQEKAIDGACLEFIPAEANVVAQRLSTPFFGGGLIEAIREETIVERADPDDSDGDGISGRVHYVPYPGRMRIGRFGWKAHEAKLLSFTSEALVTEMGITNTLAPASSPPNGDTALAAVCEAIEGAADPEDDVDPTAGFPELVKITNFSVLLAPPTEQERPSGRGWRLFRRIRCERCHTARMETGDENIPALSRVTFYPYSDFLLHDMGSLGDGIVQGDAGATEMRTAPLWGVGARTAYLHDGRVQTLAEAIEAHDGEASTSRDRFLRLNAQRRQLLLDFVAGR